MSHSYGNGHSSGNNYLNRKRAEDDIPSYYYDKYEKFDKYGNHSNPRFNNSMSYNYSKPPNKMNNYYSTNSRYYNNYYNRQKPFYNSMGYQSGLSQKRDYRKPYQKISAPGSTEGIRNLSHCDMPSSSPLSIPPRKSADSIKTLTETSSAEIKPGQNLNIKNINKFVPNMTQGPPIISHPNININIKLSSSSTNLKYNRDSKEEKKWKKKDDLDKERRYDLQLIPFPKPSPSLMNFRPFDKSLVKLEPNPLEKFVLYPNNLYEINMDAIYNSMRRANGTPIKELMNRDLISNITSLKSCYILAKIPNWRLVTNFVPASKLTNEKFGNIIALDEDDEEKKDEDDTQEKKKEIKYSLIYNDKYEDIVDKYLDENLSKKKNSKSRIFNEESIIAQYHYNTLKLKNKLKQGFFRINYLNSKHENLKNAIEGNNKSQSFHFSDFS